MKTFNIIIALVVLGCVAFEKNCFADDSDAGVSLVIIAGIAVFLKSDTSQYNQCYNNIQSFHVGLQTNFVMEAIMPLFSTSCTTFGPSGTTLDLNGDKPP